jgi:SAM-dependent methyltransferase
MSLRAAWDRRAEAWTRFARTPGHDHWYERLNLPAFLELVPPAGRATLDLGCGEGRLGAVLSRLGYRVTGVEASPTLAAHAREHHEVVEADAAALPFADGSFDLVLAFMSLHDMDEMDCAVREAARVLEPGGCFCVALEHPLQKAGAWADPDDPSSAFAIRGSYLAERRFHAVYERDGIRMDFEGVDRPIEGYARALEAAGLLIEALREPLPDDDFVRHRPRAAKWRRLPIFLHLRAVKPAPAAHPDRGSPVASPRRRPGDRAAQDGTRRAGAFNADWEREAQNWITWTRTAGHDSYWWYRELFFELVPPPGRATLELGCGEGRVCRDLAARGHLVTGLDASPTLLAAAREAGPEGEYVLADAADAPFDDASFDLVVAYNSLMDIDDMPGAVREAARVLVPGGRFCIAVVHPVADAGTWETEERFVISGSYYGRRRFEGTFERDGLTMTFRGWSYPLEAYARALETAGLLVEALREPAAPDELVGLRPTAARWQRLPNFLYLRALRP